MVGGGGGAAKLSPMLGIDTQCQPTPPMKAVNMWRHATHQPTPVASAPIPLASSQRGTRTHGPQVTQHDLQALPMPCVLDSVWAVFVGPPVPASLVRSPHTASSVTPWAALRADTKGPALAWYNLCIPAYIHMLTHMEWPVMHSPIPRDPPPFICCRAPLSCAACSCDKHRHAHCSG